MTPAIGPRPLSSLLARGVGFLILWVVLIGTTPINLLIGLAAAAAATWASGLLWPAHGGIDALGLLRFVLRFLPQSIVAGVDVARRAFAPHPMLQPGLVACRTSLPAGTARRAMCALMSLQPGKLPVAVDPDGTLHIHCLDQREPIKEQTAADEAAFCGMLRDGAGHG
ncbi:Na+/H+ antiporter subunit E [Bosea caraganae]|nr:Na+/H+ antiporter subunit E [Bosea caraganae]